MQREDVVLSTLFSRPGETVRFFWVGEGRERLLGCSLTTGKMRQEVCTRLPTERTYYDEETGGETVHQTTGEEVLATAKGLVSAIRQRVENI